MSLIKLLDRPIAFHRIFAELTGSVTAGLMLSQAVYWSGQTKTGERRTIDPDGWFWKTQEDWFEETRLTRKEQETARKHLRSLGAGDVWEEEVKGLPRRLYYRLDLEKLQSLLLDMLAAQKGHAGMSERDMQYAQKGHAGMPLSDMQCAQKGHAYKEQRLHRDYAETTTVFSGNRAKREPGKKGRIELENFGWENLSALFSEETHQWLVKRCPTVPVEEASRTFLDYHRDRGTTFAHSRALLAAWRGWMTRAEGRAGAGAKSSATGQRGLNQAELESLRLMGVEV